MTKVYIINGSGQYEQLFKSYGFEIVYDLLDSDLVVFTGGSDVTPSFYGASPHRYTMNDKARDAQERALFDKALWSEKKMVGICRGGQFLNVMSGGMMYQDVTNHTSTHDLFDIETETYITVSSTHHQMMYPGKQAQIVAVAYEDSRREWFDKGTFHTDVSEEDYEVIYYPNTNSLCFQPHPEFDKEYYPEMYEYFRQCLSRFLKV